jgi:hypothetical protein
MRASCQFYCFSISFSWNYINYLGIHCVSVLNDLFREHNCTVKPFYYILQGSLTSLLETTEQSLANCGFQVSILPLMPVTRKKKMYCF